MPTPYIKTILFEFPSYFSNILFLDINKVKRLSLIVNNLDTVCVFAGIDMYNRTFTIIFQSDNIKFVYLHFLYHLLKKKWM